MNVKTIITSLLLGVTVGAIADEPKALLDSVIIDQGTFSSKYEYTYNQNNLVDNEVYSILKSGKWTHNRKKDYTYNAMGKVELCMLYVPNIDTNGWQNNTKSEYSYNEQGDQIERKDSMWNMDGEMWLKFQQLKTSYIYDTNDRKTSSVDSFTVYDVLYYVLKYTYEYDDAGKLISVESYIWDSESEVFGKTGRRTYTYDTDGNVTEIIIYDWDDKAKTYKMNGRYQMIYDLNGYLISEVVSMLKDDGEWLLINKNTYYYHGYNTAIVNIETSGNALSTKFFRNGMLFIKHNGKIYDVTGKEVR